MQDNEFSPVKSHSPDLSLDIKASSSDEEANNNEVVDEIENYIDKEPINIEEIEDEDLENVQEQPKPNEIQKSDENFNIEEEVHINENQEYLINEENKINFIEENEVEAAKEKNHSKEKKPIWLINATQDEKLNVSNNDLNENKELNNNNNEINENSFMKTNEEENKTLEKNTTFDNENRKKLSSTIPLKRKASEAKYTLHEDFSLSSPKKKLKTTFPFKQISSSKDPLKSKDSMVLESINIENDEEDDDLFDAETIIKKKKTLKDDFEPGNIENPEIVFTEEDIEIIRSDIPERLQLRAQRFSKEIHKGCLDQSADDLCKESQWICERFKVQKNTFTNENMVKKIQKVLNFIKTGCFEATYLNLYKKNELYPDIQLQELWDIYEYDEEWVQLSVLRKCVEKNLNTLENFMEIPEKVRKYLEEGVDKTCLNNLQDYAVFHLSKYLDAENSYKISYPNQKDSKKTSKRVFAYEALQLKLDKFAEIAGLSCEEFAENLINELKMHKKSLVKKPKYVEKTPELVAKEYVNKDNSLVNDSLTTMTTLCRYMASEIFQQPLIRHHVMKIYNQSVKISSEPTLKGNKELDIYNPYFLVKRINRRPASEFTDDLWLKMMKCEREGLIKIRLILPWEEDLKDNHKDCHDMKDEIYEKLLNLYIGSYQDTNEEEKTLIILWNILRGEVLRIFLVELMYPFLQKALKEELTEQSEKYVITACSKKLKQLLSTAPYLITREEDPYTLYKPKVISVVLENTNFNSSSGKISFVCVDPHGVLLDHLSLKFYALPNIDLQSSSSIKEAYEKDVREFELFMKKHSPDLVIVSTNCLEARRIKQMMVNFREDWQKNINIDSYKNISEKPMENTNEKPYYFKNFNVIYGDNVIPNLFAKTRRAENEFKGFPLNVKEGISLARFVQNPLAETLNLWSEKNQENAVFYIPLHPLQNQINLNKLRKEYEKIVIEIVNNVGVDFNELLKYRHLQALLPFISGLGPRKAQYLLECFENCKEESRVLRSRSQLLTEKLLEKKVYTNCVGFFRIKLEQEYELFDFERPDKQYEMLDFTRIHPENYALAKKIAKDALDEDAGVNPQELIPKIMRNSFKLKELDLDDYANHLAANKNKPNMIYVLSFIVEELISPFRDNRNHPLLYNPKDIFYKLSRENPETFKPNGLINAKITKILKSNLLCRLDNGLVGAIYYLDIFEKKDSGSGENLNHFFEEGQNIKAKIKSIDFEKFRIELTMKPSDLKLDRNSLKELYPNYWENLSKFFKLSKCLLI